jgi:DnaK suppressor protein
MERNVRHRLAAAAAVAEQRERERRLTRPTLVLVKQDPRKWLEAMIEASRRELIPSWEDARARDHGIDRDDLADDMDLASAEFAQGLELQLLDREKHLLDEIQSAVRRIEDGTYGICEGCGVQIPPKRLAAQPTATLCVQCKEDEERDAKRFA